MATLNITVDDSQVSRVRTAYGAETNAELRTAIIQDIKRKVAGYEIGVAQATADVDIQAAHNAARTATINAQNNAEALNIT